MANELQRNPTGYDESSWAVLGGVRFVLAAIVFASHLWWFAAVPPAMEGFARLGGRAAVLGFLLVSGVSIGHSYRERPAGFYVRRFLRIYPMYFVAVAFAGLLMLNLGPACVLPGITLKATGWKTVAANFFLLQGFAGIAVTFNEPLWTLSMEVFYYALAPWLWKVRGAVLAAMIAVSMVLFEFFPREWLFGYGAARYAWPWLAGFLFMRSGKMVLPGMFAAAGVVMMAVKGTDTPETLSWVTFAVTGAVVFRGDMFQFPAWARVVLDYLGELSYPLYLFYVPLCIALVRYGGVRGAWWLVALALSLTAVMNQVFDHWFKKWFWKPVMRLPWLPWNASSATAAAAVQE